MRDNRVLDSTFTTSGSLKRLIRPTIIITLLTLAGQGVGFVTQMAIAASFGARADMDAFLAANTLPQYITAVFLTPLSVVFIPVFIDYMTTGREAEAWQVASRVISLFMLVLGGIAAIGMFFASNLLRLTTPGLSPSSLQLASLLAIINWPTIVVTGLASLLAGIYQAQGRFSWPAIATVLGALLNLSLVVFLARSFGVIGLAIAAATNICLQSILLLPVLFRRAQYRFTLNLDHSGVRQVLSLIWPLILSNLLICGTPIIDRYLASGLEEGTISHLGYAFKLYGVLAILISTGLTKVLFPRMAINIVKSGLLSMRHTVSQGLRFMWLIITPVICVGTVLALPLVTILFQRGQFNNADTRAVAGLFQIYLLALAGACLGNITTGGLYVLKETRIVAIIASLETLGYILYTPLLTRLLGAPGVALSYVIYFSPGLVWSTILIRYKTGNTGGRTVLVSFLRTGLAALLGGAAAWGMMRSTSNVWIQLVFGGVSGLLVYATGLWILKSSEIRQLWNTFRQMGKAKPPIHAVED